MLEENKARLDKEVKNICRDLEVILSPWLLKARPFAKVEKRFRQEILDPAIGLHKALKSSSHQYEMRTAEALENLAPEQLREEWRLKDADIWQELRGSRTIGRALYCLHPSIVRPRLQSTAPVVVAKGVLVVKSSDESMSADLADTNNQRVSAEGTLASSPMTQIRSVTELTLTFYPSDFNQRTSSMGSPRIPIKTTSYRVSGQKLHDLEEREVFTTSSLESLGSNDLLRRKSESEDVEDRQQTEKARGYEAYTSNQRGHHIEGRRAETLPYRTVKREPSPFGSRDRAIQKSRRRNSASENSASGAGLALEDPKTKSGSLMSAWSSWMQRSVQERL